MKPLCKKDYLHRIGAIFFILFGTIFDVILIVNADEWWFILVLPLTALIVYEVIMTVHWMLQPNVLIYQYDEGIVINRNIKIEYEAIEKINYENYYLMGSRRELPQKTPYVGTIVIKLKSGEKHKIRNVDYPIEAVDVLSKIKKQKKFK